MRIMLDTNITIDILTNRQPFCTDSIACYKKALLHGDKIYISTVSVADVMYITKHYFSDKSKQLQIVLNFINTLKIAKVTEKDLRFGFSGVMPDFEDALQYYSAMTEQADMIITRNGKDFKHATIPIYTPVQFLELMEDEINRI